jgi:hypothetical protein
MKALYVGLTLTLCSLGLSCGSDDEERPAECVAIQEACHAADPGTGPIHACHENAEEKWTKAECMTNSASCLAMCKAVGADASAGN